MRSCNDCFNQISPSRIIDSNHPLKNYFRGDHPYNYPTYHDHCSIYLNLRNPNRCPKFKKIPTECAECGVKIDNPPFYLSFGRCRDCLFKYMKHAQEVIDKEFALVLYYSDQNQKGNASRIDASKIGWKIKDLLYSNHDFTNYFKKYRNMVSVLNYIKKKDFAQNVKKIYSMDIIKMDSKTLIKHSTGLTQPKSILNELAKFIHSSILYYSLIGPCVLMPYSFFREIHHTKAYWIALNYWSHRKNEFYEIIELLIDFKIEIIKISIEHGNHEEQIQIIKEICLKLKQYNNSKLMKNLKHLYINRLKKGIRTKGFFKKNLNEYNFNIESNKYKRKNLFELIQLTSGPQRVENWLYR